MVNCSSRGLKELNLKQFLSGGNNIGDFTSRDKTEDTPIRYASNEKLPLSEFAGACK